MQVFRGFHHPGIAPACALTIGNFDGVHRGHQAMLALLRSEAQHRGLPSCVMTFEPHPRDFFAARAGKPELAPTRIASLRDKLAELERCGIDQVVILRFDEQLASLSAQDFITQVLEEGLGAKYILVGDDFRFGAKRLGDYATLDAAGRVRGFDVARMMSYEVHGLRVSSSAVREALGRGDMEAAARCWAGPNPFPATWCTAAKLGRSLGFRTLNLRFAHDKRPPRASSLCARMAWRSGQLTASPRSASGPPSKTPAPAARSALLQWPAELGVEGAYGKTRPRGTAAQTP